MGISDFGLREGAAQIHGRRKFFMRKQYEWDDKENLIQKGRCFMKCAAPPPRNPQSAIRNPFLFIPHSFDIMRMWPAFSSLLMYS